MGGPTGEDSARATAASRANESVLTAVSRAQVGSSIVADTPVDPAGTIRALHFAAGPRIPAYLTRYALGAAGI